jgi:hypothetical protein
MMTAGALPLATCALVVAVLAQAGAPAPSGSPYGKPEVMKFKGGRPAAFSMQFDDSIDCQAVFAIPEMNKRGLVGTFFVNPALDRYKRHAEVWEVVCPKYGHELANHTMHHAGAKDDEDAAYEIGECSRQIWKIYPNGSKLRPFLSGGGTEWNCSRETRRALMRQYYLFSGMGGFRGAEGQPEREEGEAPGRAGCAEGRENARCAKFAERALETGKWFQVGFHGIGEAWIVTSKEHFIELLDYLAAHRDQIWVATTGSVFKYTQERDAVDAITLSDATETGFTLAVHCDESKVDTYDLTLPELYDEPLTVQVSVPDSWKRVQVVQGEGEPVVTETVDLDGRRCARVDVLPNVPAATVTVVE